MNILRGKRSLEIAERARSLRLYGWQTTSFRHRFSSQTMGGSDAAGHRGARRLLASRWRLKGKAQQSRRVAWAAISGERMKQHRHEGSLGGQAQQIPLGIEDDSMGAASLGPRDGGGGESGFGAPAEDAALLGHGATSARAGMGASIDPSPMPATRAWYAREFKLTSAFIGVTQLAAILDIAPSTIYTMIRAGTFFMPHRMMGASIKVWIDDLVAWHLSGARMSPAQKPQRSRSSLEKGDGEEAQSPRALSQAEVNQAVSKAADDALRAAGINPSMRRRSKKAR